jgi:uncharacterized membrane protein (DUF485 family)
MKKSLFTKLMTTYFIVMVISYILVAFFVSYWFTTYYYEQKASGLIREGEKLYDVVFDYVNGKISADRLQFELSVTGRFLNARISVVDNYGYPWGSSESNTGDTMEKQLTNVDIEDVRRGEIVVRRGSFTTSLTTPMLTVGIPVFIMDRLGGGFTFSPR